MIGGFLCKVSLAHLADQGVATYNAPKFSAAGRQVVLQPEAREQVKPLSALQIPALSTQNCRYQQDEKGVSLGEFWQEGKESPTKACLSAFLKQNMGSHLSK